MRESSGSVTIGWTWEHDNEDLEQDFDLEVSYSGEEEDDGSAHDYIPPRTFMAYRATDISCDNELAEKEANWRYNNDTAFNEWINEQIGERA